MLGTLRFRLTEVFLAVVLVFGLVSIALAVRLFQDVTRQQSVDELRREASGLAALYAESALRSSDEGTKAPEFAASQRALASASCTGGVAGSTRSGSAPVETSASAYRPCSG